MIRVGSLLWSLIVAVAVSGLSLFYTQNNKAGYPFAAIYQTETGESIFNWTVFFADLIFWWLIFSILLVVVKNYLIDSYQDKEKEKEIKDQEKEIKD